MHDTRYLSHVHVCKKYGRNMKERASKIKDFFKGINQWLKGNAGFQRQLEMKEEEEILVPLVRLQTEIEDDFVEPIIANTNTQRNINPSDHQVAEEQALLSILYDETVHLDHHPTSMTHQKIKEKFDQFSQKETIELTDEMLEHLITQPTDETEDLLLPLMSNQSNLENQSNPSKENQNTPKRGMILLRSGKEFLRLKTENWRVLCTSLKLAKTFDAQKISDLTLGKSQLTVRELWMIRTHIETILFAVMCSGDYLLSDLSISDSHPSEALVLPDDPRKFEFIDRKTLEQIVFFSKNAHYPISVQMLLWREDALMS